MPKLNQLTPEEERVIAGKGTEAPFSGEYDANKRPGAYFCRRCGARLYESKDKFDSGCGWPSFDDEIKGAVKRQPDADGQRTEITCANCNAHLGHVFEGEKLTPKDTRHCVNSLSMKFIPEDFAPDEENYAVFGGGCFWCGDAEFSRVKGVKEVTAGYAGGESLSPTYENIDGHAETIKIVFDPAVVSYRQLLKIFFATHNPTTPNRQGNDIGEQYRSIILYATLAQKAQAEELIARLSADRVFDAPIVTQVEPLFAFHPAEDYHQDYYAKNPDQAYCQAVINPKLSKLREEFGELVEG